MNYATIKFNDIANGPGVRTSLFVSGCTHGCKGCFNRIAWDFRYGQKFDETVEKEILDSLAPEYISGLTRLGGEPLEPVNQPGILPLAEAFGARYPCKSLWIYSGFTFDVDLIPGGRAYTPVTDRILSCCHVLVDGKFIEEQRDITLRFRGSTNQRLIDVPASLAKGEVVLWEGAADFAVHTM